MCFVFVLYSLNTFSLQNGEVQILESLDKSPFGDQGHLDVDHVDPASFLKISGTRLEGQYKSPEPKDPKLYSDFKNRGIGWKSGNFEGNFSKKLRICFLVLLFIVSHFRVFSQFRLRNEQKT